VGGVARSGGPFPPVVLYDGVCNFCSRWVRFILPRDPRGALRFASLQSDAGRALIGDCGLHERPESIVLIEDGRCFDRSEAVLRIARRLTLPWRIVWWLRVLPRPLRDRFYDAFAARRYRWFGRKDVCDIPPPEWRARFLDEPQRRANS
jgi:predicted DCC family thiol-disulfide oxidoreductase YuxK